MRYWINKILNEKVYLLLLTLFITVIILDHRRPDALTNAQFWMEDGEIFFLDSYKKGFLSIFYPYAQYLHFFPRSISILGNYLIPVSHLPLFYNIASLITFLFTAVYIWLRGSENKITSILMIFTLTLLPIHNEVFMNITNQQWSLAFILLLPLAYQRKSKIWSVLDSFLILVAGLSGPFSVIFFPVVLIKYFFSRAQIKENHYLRFPFISFAFTACLQLISIFYHPMQRSIGDPDIKEFLLASIQLFYQHFAVLTSNPDWIYLKNPITYLLGITLFLGLFILWTATFDRNIQSNKFASFIFLSASFCIFLSTLYGFRNNPGMLDPITTDRYFYIPTIAFFWALFNYFEHKTYFLYCCILCFTFLFIFRNKVIPVKTFQDMEWKKYAGKFKKNDPFEIPINPPNRGWIIKVVPKK